MTVTWLIDTTIIEGKLSGKLPDVARELGHKVETFSMDKGQYHWQDFWCDEGAGPVIAYGCVNFIKHFHKSIPAIPGTYPYTNFELLKPSNFMSRIFLQDLLNDDHFFVSIRNLIDNHEFYFGVLQVDSLFLKDDLVNKRFTGTVIQKKNWVDKLNFLASVHKINPDELFLISTKKEIFSEHRLIVVDNKIVAHSTYAVDSVLDIRTDMPDKVLNFAQEILDSQVLDQIPAYSLDIALVGNNVEESKPKVIEINGFSTSGLYGCDLYAIVKAISEKAERDYDEYMDIR